MDPISVLSLASNLVQLIDVTTRLLHESYQVFKTGQHRLARNEAVAQLVEDFRGLGLQEIVSLETSPEENSLKKLSQRCEAEVSQVLGLLSGLKLDQKAGKLKLVGNAIKVGFKSETVAKKLAAHQESLHELSTLLSTALLKLIRKEQTAGFAKLLLHVETAKQETSEAISNLKAELLGTIQSRKNDRIQKLLDSLAYPQVHYRHDDISSAAKRTFRWILGPQSEFRQWLIGGEGIFWISGKAGSGKSTLMKFLHHNSAMLDLLKQWSGSSRLKIARHYFWYAGSSVQKTHEGLLRSLLYDILRQAQGDEVFDIAVKMCPNLLNRLQNHRPDAWSIDELSEALLAVKLIQETKFCFFVDGLDEYYPQQDQVKLMRLIRELATFPNVKLCVSSRPWHIFSTNLSNGNHTLKLEELTFNDMRSYVRNELKEEEELNGFFEDFQRDTDLAKSLVNETAKRAEGVFLWTQLVVKLLKEELAAGRHISRLQNCLDDFPRDLHTFFKSLIFDRVSWRNRTDTAKTLTLGLRLASVYGGWNHYDLYQSGRQSFLNFWLLAQPNFLKWPNETEINSLSLFSNGELDIMKRETSAFLGQVCKDFLRVNDRGIEIQCSGSTAMKRAISEKSQDSEPYNEAGCYSAELQLESPPSRIASSNDSWLKTPPGDGFTSNVADLVFSQAVQDEGGFESRPQAKFEVKPAVNRDGAFTSTDQKSTSKLSKRIFGGLRPLKKAKGLSDPILDGGNDFNESLQIVPFAPSSTPVSSWVERGGQVAKRTHILEVGVDFLHRMVFDFLISDEMQRLLNDHLPARWIGPDILPEFDVARLRIVPSQYSDPCALMTSCVESTRSLWLAGSGLHEETADTLGALATVHFERLCRPRCRLDRQHSRMAFSWRSDDKNRAYLSAMLNKHPEWCWTSFFGLLVNQQMKRGLDTIDLKMWQEYMKSGFAGFGNSESLTMFHERFANACGTSSRTSEKSEWTFLWELLTELVTIGLIKADARVMSKMTFQEALARHAPSTRTDELSEFCTAFFTNDVQHSKRTVQGKHHYLLEIAPESWLTQTLVNSNFRDLFD